MYNRSILMGRICNDLEVKTTNSGAAVCSFRIAVERRYQADKSNKVTDFFNLVAWRQTAEFLEKYFSKGDMVLVEGELQTRKYQDKTTGKDITVTELNVDNVSFCGGKSDNQQSRPQGTPPVAASVPPVVTAPASQTAPSDDDYPF